MTHRYRLIALFLILCVGFSVLPTPNVSAAKQCDPDGKQASGAIYRICMPESRNWNGILIIYAHGYSCGVAPAF